MPEHVTASFFLAFIAVLVLARVLGTAARKIGQPAVLGEILAGILIGPTLLNGEIAEALLPMDVRPYLSGLGTIGLAIFMFATGAELERTLLRSEGRAAMTTGAVSVVFPFILGCALGLYLLRRTPTDHSVGFVLFLGAATSVTAFPVLARILSDRGLLTTRIGGIALSAAMLADLIAWSTLAMVLAVIGAGQWHALLIPVYLLLMWSAVRPLLRKALLRAGPATATPVVVGLLLSCCAAQWIGLHFIFGAFAFGAVMPRDLSDKAARSVQQLSQFSTPFLLPVFFVMAGLKVDLSELDGEALTDLALILLVAVTGKVIGAWGGARLGGLRGRDTWILATLMNTRGLTELVVLTVGLQLGLLNNQLFSLMVVMALVTTYMTGPVLALLTRKDPSSPPAAPEPGGTQDAARAAAPAGPSKEL
ncbi:cation:proton antiporter [Streptomyces sp. NPDC058401]|uniref:cation:proton antiporter domain-containing protein n=1 Tax=Streptomyces sp. NPDC058401 TaxID=3346480 RepID=UPI003662AFB0